MTKHIDPVMQAIGKAGQYLKILAIVAILGLVALLVSMSASAAICPIKPIPPIGCTDDNAVCICDENGCKWIWVGCR